MTNGNPGSSSPTPAAPTSGLAYHPTLSNLNAPSTTSTSMPTFAEPHRETDPGTDPETGGDRTGSVPEKKGSNSSNGKRRSSYASMASDSDSDQDSVGSFAYAYGRSSTGSAGVSSVNFGGAAYRGDDDRVNKGRAGSEGDVASRGGRGRAGGAGGAGDDELEWLERARARTAEVLQERKKMKRRLGLAAERFNTGSKEWLEYAQVVVVRLLLHLAEIIKKNVCDQEREVAVVVAVVAVAAVVVFVMFFLLSFLQLYFGGIRC